MNFKDLMTDCIDVVKPDVRKFRVSNAVVEGTTVSFDDVSVPVEEGDVVEHALPNGLIQKFEVLDRGYHAAFKTILAGYEMRVRRLR
jgi:hypothetical protein